MKKIALIFGVVLLVVLLVVLFVGYADSRMDNSVNASSSQIGGKEEQPTLYVMDAMYADTGEMVDKLPEGWTLAGSIIEQVNATETPRENLTSTHLAIGDKVFTNEENPDDVYVQRQDVTGELYARYALIHSSAPGTVENPIAREPQAPDTDETQAASLNPDDENMVSHSLG